MTQKQGWGTAPTSGGGKRDVPYIDYNGADVAQFVPLPDITYHMTVLNINGWDQPVEMWTHDLFVNGRYMANVYCKNISLSHDNCPFCRDNRLAEGRNRQIKNADKPFPLKKKFVFPIVVDEVPEKPFLLYKVSQKFMENIANQFMMAGNDNVKLAIRRTGGGKTDTTYTVSNSGMPVDKNVVKNAKVPKITSSTFKKLIIDLEDFEKFEFIDLSKLESAGGTQFNTSVSEQQQATQQQATQQQVSQQPDNNGQPEGDVPFEPPANGAAAPELQKAKDYVMSFGPYAGKKLGELEKQVLETIARNMTGEIQSFASLILNNIK